MLELLILVWLIGTACAAGIAEKKGRSAPAFGLFSFFFSPALGILAALVVAENENALSERKLQAGRAKRCRYCREVINYDACVCRFCGRDYEPIHKDRAQSGEKIVYVRRGAAGNAEGPYTLNEIRNICQNVIDDSWYWIEGQKDDCGKEVEDLVHFGFSF